MIASQRFGEARGGRRRSSRALSAPRCVLPRYKVFNSPAHAKPTKISSSFAMTRRQNAKSAKKLSYDRTDDRSTDRAGLDQRALY